MKLKIKEKNDYLRLLNVIVPWDELKGEYEKEYKKIKSNYSMPGFRKGSVPDNIVRNFFLLNNAYSNHCNCFGVCKNLFD